MKTLADAWEWYLSTKRNLDLLQGLGLKHWAGSSMENASIGGDEKFKELEPATIGQETEIGLRPIDDLAVVVLFSVFEAIVRNHVAARIEPEAAGLSDPILKQAG